MHCTTFRLDFPSLLQMKWYIKTPTVPNILLAKRNVRGRATTRRFSVREGRKSSVKNPRMLSTILRKNVKERGENEEKTRLEKRKKLKVEKLGIYSAAAAPSQPAYIDISLVPENTQPLQTWRSVLNHAIVCFCATELPSNSIKAWSMRDLHWPRIDHRFARSIPAPSRE